MAEKPREAAPFNILFTDNHADDPFFFNPLCHDDTFLRRRLPEGNIQSAGAYLLNVI